MSRVETTEQKSVTRKVQSFYASLPFNFHHSKEQASETLREENPVEFYKNLDALLRRTNGATRVLDVGCGAGWFVNSVAFHYGLSVVGIDLCEVALERAQAVSRELGVSERTRFQLKDLLEGEAFSEEFFLVNSIGVLHHTFDCHASLAQICQWVQPGGYLHLGLYHRYGREPFLQLFQEYRNQLRAAKTADAQEAITRRAYDHYKAINRHCRDELFLTSWFKDQVLHPHESQHTVEELFGWLAELGFTCLSTSINQFEPISSWQEIFQEEKKLSRLSYQRNVVEQRYFPGFFTLLARRKDVSGAA